MKEVLWSVSERQWKERHSSHKLVIARLTSLWELQSVTFWTIFLLGADFNFILSGTPLFGCASDAGIEDRVIG